MLNLTLEDVPFAILDAVQARILRSRARRDPPARPRPSLRPRPQQRRFGASSSRWVRPQAAVAPVQMSPIGHLWWFGKAEGITNFGVRYDSLFGRVTYREWFVGYRYTTRLYCGNGTQYIEISHGLQQGQMLAGYSGFSVGSTVGATIAEAGEQGADLFVMPAGRDNMIVLFFAWNYRSYINTLVEIEEYFGESYGSIVASAKRPATGTSSVVGGLEYVPLSSFSKAEQVSSVVRAFVCSNTGIREITVPSGFAGIRNAMFSQSVQDHRFTHRDGLSNRFFYADSTIPVFTRRWTYASLESTAGMSIFRGYPRTPAVYHVACSALPPASFAWSNVIGNIVQPINPRLGWIVDEGIRGHNGYDYMDSRPLYYRQLLRPIAQIPDTWGDDPSTYSEEQPDRSHRLHPNRIEPEGFSLFSSFGLPSGLRAVWDWDNPGYCRDVCLALGFRAADLQP